MRTFSFACPKEKDTKKKRPGLSLRRYSDTAIRRRGYNSLRSNSRPLPAPDSASALRACAYARGLRRESLNKNPAVSLPNPEPYFPSPETSSPLSSPLYQGKKQGKEDRYGFQAVNAGLSPLLFRYPASASPLPFGEGTGVGFSASSQGR